MAVSIRELQLQLQHNRSIISDISLSQIMLFIPLVSRLQDDILLAQPAHLSATIAPDVLPPAVTDFLSDCCKLTGDEVQGLWDVLKSTIWHADADEDRAAAVFADYGHKRGLTYQTFFPPHHYCVNASCPRTKRGLLMKKSEARQTVFYTLNSGALPAYAIHLYCPACKINHHHNFYVQHGQRVYYDTVPDVIQVGEHQFAERKLINLWINLMLVSWTSATNCARLYNISLSPDNVPPDGWPFTFTISSDHVWSGFLTLALLEDSNLRQQTLIVPHDGLQRDRFTAAVRARNARFRLFSQPELRHHCQKCLRLYRNENGQVDRKVWVVVIDGVTVGHPCCAVHNCHTPLTNNRHRFCSDHLPTHGHVCAIVGCNKPILRDSLACDDPDHQEVQRVHRERGQARFQLKERLQRARVAHPNDVIADLTDADDVDDEFEIPGGHLTTTTNRKKLRAQFGRKRTHNEQIIVAPCGIIIARETFYGAEGIASVVEMIKRTFRGDIKPDHIFFDNNCSLAKMVKDDPFFQDIGLTVDVFHFKCKHSETDTFCQTHCNPAAFPELVSENDQGWYFNSSIAEQTNVWLGGYHSICREMLVDKYNFFLDEMVMWRNRVVKQKLAKEGHSPQTWSVHA